MKKFLKFCISTILLVVGLVVITDNVQAETTYSATVTADLLNVRAEATSSSKKIGSVKKGATVIVYKKGINGWAKIQYQNKIGYVSEKHLKYQQGQSELQQIKNHALKGTTPHSTKIKVGDTVQKVINNYGKTDGEGLREYHILYYKDFATLYFGDQDGEGGYSKYNSKTKINNISSKLKKAYSYNELTKVFGTKFVRGYDTIPHEVFIYSDIGDYSIYFTAIETVNPEESESIPLSKLTFEEYTVVKKN